MTPSTVPAIRRPSYTRRLYQRSGNFFYMIRMIALHGQDGELELFFDYLDTDPFPYGEPPLQDYWRAFQAWRQGGGWR